jgi:PAS domain S-box-containing protein
MAGARTDFKDLFERTPGGVVVLRIVRGRRGAPADAVILEANPAFEAITGLAADKVVGKRASEALPGMHPPWAEVLDRVAKSGESVQAENHDASVGRYLEATVFALARGRIAVLFADVTDRKWGEEDTRANRERLRFILESTRDVIYATAPDGTITYVSPQIAILGCTPDQIIGTDMLSHIHPDDVGGVMAVLQKAIATGYEMPLCFRLVGPDGRVVHFEESGKIHRRDGRMTGITGVLRDVTERAQREAAHGELSRRHEEALALIAELGALLPVCPRCGRRHDDSDLRARLEAFLASRGGPGAATGLCAECAGG